MRPRIKDFVTICQWAVFVAGQITFAGVLSAVLFGAAHLFGHF